MTSRLRFVVFSPSIVSDIGNPRAATVRSICQALVDAEHDVTHLEERGNPHVTELLRTHGYAPLRAFNEQHPLVRYRQFTVGGGWERVIWFGREIATADVVVAYPGVPGAIVEQVAAIDSPRIIAFWPGASKEVGDLLPLWYAPIQLPSDSSTQSESNDVVAYDNITHVSEDASSRAKRLATEIERLLARRQQS